MSVKIIIADDHQMIVEGLTLLLEQEKDVNIVATAKNGKEVLHLVETLTEIDLIILDINMPVLDGIEVTKIIKSNYPEIKILVLSTYKRVEFIKNLMNAGADGYILKSSGKKILLEAIEILIKEEKYFGKEVLDAMEDSQVEKTVSKDLKTIELSKREKEVVKLIVKGMSSTEMAAELFIGIHAINSHRKSILNKLDVKNVAGIFRFALQSGLVKGFDL